MMTKGWTYRDCTEIPYRIWQYLPAAAAAYAAMQDPDRPGNKG